MGKINDLPFLERPREKAWRYGIESLSNNELLAIIINSGTKNHSALDIADDLLSFHHGLSKLGDVPFEEFSKINGLNKVASLKVGSVFEIAKRYQRLKDYSEDFQDIDTIVRKFKTYCSKQTQEMMEIVVLNKYKKIVYECLLYQGSENNIAFSFRDIFKVAFSHNGYSFYLIHNHPNGIALPSEKDIIFTRDLIKECKKVHLKLIDHLILGSDEVFSFSKYIIECKNENQKKID